MSTPTVERPGVARRQSARRGARDGAADGARRDTLGAVDRAYARRAGRRDRLGGPDTEAPERRSQFVLSIMALLGVGLVTSLWLSTTAAADSYRLNEARQATTDLSERTQIVQSQIDAMQSPPAIARAASSLGMVQVSDVARLIVGPDGKVSVFGTPKAASGPPAPAVTAPSAPVAQAPVAQAPVAQAPVAAPAPAATAPSTPVTQAPVDQTAPVNEPATVGQTSPAPSAGTGH
jgi:hypothetical protein